MKNKMAVERIKGLFWKMGLPMIISMVLQALYNVVDSIFVANMKDTGALANEALTFAFPIQIMIIAIGVGTGVGLNAVLSKSLGEKNSEKVNKIAGNGIFLGVVIYAVFLLFGLFFSEKFIGLFTDNPDVLKMGSEYLFICTCFSLGSIGFTIYERFLQATGKTMCSTISQILGALTNIILDYVFIFPLDMGVSAALMQALLSVMMAGVNAILGNAEADSTVLVGSFGIYYKIQQIALFSSFGLSNTIITLLSFNYGMKDKQRARECIKFGIIDTVAVAFIITVLFEIIARPLSELFALSGGSSQRLVEVCSAATRIASLGFVFMGFSVAVQGVLQALGYAAKPLILALLRLVVFVFPICYIFTLSENVLNIVWWTFPIAEFLTCIFALWFLKQAAAKKISVMQ